MVKWKIIFNDLSEMYGDVFDSSWGNVQEYIDQKNNQNTEDPLKIIELCISHKNGREFRVKNSNAYFLGKKVRKDLQTGREGHLVGVGHKKPDGFLKIKWFLVDDKIMELAEDEERDSNKKDFFVVKNP